MDVLFINRFGVYHWTEYVFEDGSSKDKYWISLNCTINQKEYHAILPTSKVEKHKLNKIDTFVIDEKRSQYFTKPTLLDFKKLKIDKKDVIEKAYQDSKFKYLGLLEKEIQSDIENSIINSETLSQILIDKLLCKGSQ